MGHEYGVLADDEEYGTLALSLQLDEYIKFAIGNSTFPLT
jgi:hypothetical protein